MIFWTCFIQNLLMSPICKSSKNYILKMKSSANVCHGHKKLILEAYLKYITEERIDCVKADIENQEYKIEIDVEIVSAVKNLTCEIVSDIFIIIEDDNRIENTLFCYLNKCFIDYFNNNTLQYIDLENIFKIIISFIIDRVKGEIRCFMENIHTEYLNEKDSFYMEGKIYYDDIGTKGLTKVFRTEDDDALIEVNELFLFVKKRYTKFKDFAAHILNAIHTDYAEIVKTNSLLLINLEIEEYFMSYFSEVLFSVISLNSIPEMEFINMIDHSLKNLVDEITMFANDMENLTENMANNIIYALLTENGIRTTKEGNLDNGAHNFLYIKYQIVDYSQKLFVIDDFIKCLLLESNLIFDEKDQTTITKSKKLYQDTCIKCLDLIFADLSLRKH